MKTCDYCTSEIDTSAMDGFGYYVDAYTKRTVNFHMECLECLPEPEWLTKNEIRIEVKEEE